MPISFQGSTRPASSNKRSGRSPPPNLLQWASGLPRTPASACMPVWPSRESSISRAASTASTSTSPTHATHDCSVPASLPHVTPSQCPVCSFPPRSICSIRASPLPVHLLSPRRLQAYLSPTNCRSRPKVSCWSTKGWKPSIRRLPCSIGPSLSIPTTPSPTL